MAEIFCFRCELDKMKKKTKVLHNIMCEKATPEEIQQAGSEHMSKFSSLWVAVQAYLLKGKDSE